MSRRGSIDFDENPWDSVVMRTIPSGTMCNLWDKDNITKSHFILTDDITVLVKRGHGPLASFIKHMSSPMHDKWWNNISFVNNMLNKDESSDDIYSYLADKYIDASAIFMAFSNDGRIALKYLDKGIKPDISLLK